jgi:hypothetical protein
VKLEVFKMQPNRIFVLPLTFNLKPLTIISERSKAVKAKVFILGLLFAVLFWTSLSNSQVPQMINYSGKLTTAQGNLLNGPYNMTFSIYDDSIGGNLLWTETQSGALVENGVFSVLLGNLNPIPFDIWGNGPRYLGVTIGTGPEMTPRKPMVSVPYAQRSGDWAINGNNIYRLNGNVGIGTTTPLYTLDVDGDARIYCSPDPNSYIKLNPNESGSCNSVGITMNEHRNNNFLSIEAYDPSYGNYISTRDPAAAYGQGFGIVGGPNVAPFERFVVNTDSMFLGYSKKAGNGSSAGGGNGGGNLFVRGNIGIGTTSPQGALDVSSTTGAFIVPRMTTAQRDALTAVNGMIIYNTTDNQFNFRENGVWVTK